MKKKEAKRLVHQLRTEAKKLKSHARVCQENDLGVTANIFLAEAKGLKRAARLVKDFVS